MQVETPSSSSGLATEDFVIVDRSQASCPQYTLPTTSAPPQKDDSNNGHVYNDATQRQTESIVDRIVRVGLDEQDIKAFYNVPGSTARHDRLSTFYATELASLPAAAFGSHSLQDRADYLLLKGYLNRAQRNLRLEKEHNDDVDGFIGCISRQIRPWCEKRQRVDPIKPQEMATSLHDTARRVAKYKAAIVNESGPPPTLPKVTAYRVIKTLISLSELLAETVSFYKGYDPLFDWWVTAPHAELATELAGLVSAIRAHILGIQPGDEDIILGDPIGRDGLLTELEAELICYTPEELLQIAEKEFIWCEEEMKKAAADLGFRSDGSDWKDALEKVKNMYEPPGSQPVFIQALVREGSEYVQKHDLVTVPQLAEEGIRMYMIDAAMQKVSPFFLGGPYLQVSYPTASMPHADKLMSLRGNNRYFSRATAFHEMIPGHHLQEFVAERSARARHRAKLFTTPFYIEGWALYWEMVLWNRGDFFVSPEDKIGSLFWRMHRCVRIVFSLKFHLGELSAQECVDLLVDRVGHERSTAEGEVRRSLNGDYSPLYQAGYMLGALQIMALRKEAVEAEGGMGEKAFHDQILAEGEMPIEMLRALILQQDLKLDFNSTWRFYDL
ncbi:uncharacterized protein B0I36DRAFT_328746 [Microdochium trichocladiopsis]|uniref:X-Pro dipeptidyl-peptidase n=1 Tax=Microdochium trichocladiopsis TaxID=1682393 RepID=A0A9P8Y437_9PEZI|nr:uncharacterized protein B0I36DRAFT_328746 [Microdochium trichocladiopsis]KAH7028169.1 hypothetical protein B0I36DRAFT_328746 [Microdochium trichocladiopsis]